MQAALYSYQLMLKEELERLGGGFGCDGPFWVVMVALET